MKALQNLNAVKVAVVIVSLLLAFSFWRHGEHGHCQSQMKNRLAKSASPYLRAAAHQPIDWYEWSAEAFARAKSEKKPILLDIGAVWCHWCHVMDETTYMDHDIAQVLNKNFICIKVDRDERPDIDRRYQETAGVLGAGGWPLTAFLTPDGRVFAAGTYFPPTDTDSRIGLKTVLDRIVRAWSVQHEQVLQTAEKIREALTGSQDSSGRTGFSSALIDSIWANIQGSYDEKYGGFGKPEALSEDGVPLGAKFPAGTAIELALIRAFESKDAATLQLAKKTLNAMADGGLHDQIGGGFHRYSVDGAWRIPHFEKMLYVQAELLRCYAIAYQVSGAERYKEIAEDIINYVNRELRDEEQGGFFASQDADFGPGDDGAYYTWLPEEVLAVLTPEEHNAALRYFGLDDRRNRMPAEGGKPERFVLQRGFAYEQLSRRLNLPADRVQALIESSSRKLLEARTKRKSPFIDRTLYANWNGMMIAASIQAYRAFGARPVRDFALKTCDRMLSEAYTNGKGMRHRLSDSASAGEMLLDDQAQMARALIDCYEVSANAKYLEAARDLMEFTRAQMWDRSSGLPGQGGFFDRVHRYNDLAFLSIPQKPLEDAPTPGANAVAAITLLRLSAATGESRYRDWAAETLKALAGRAQEFGRFSATYAEATKSYFEPAPTVYVIGKRDELKTQLLWSAALRTYRPGSFVFLKDPAEPNLPYPASQDGKPIAYVCSGNSCAPPINETKQLAETLQTWGLKAKPTAKARFDRRM